jgi:hypothetical protein
MEYLIQELKADKKLKVAQVVTLILKHIIQEVTQLLGEAKVVQPQ